MSDSPALAVSGLSVRLGPSALWRFADFAVPRGRTLGLAGGNGSGKTTLIRALAGALAPHTGQIVFSGDDITRSTPETRVAAGLAFMPQKNNVFPHLSVTDNLLVAVSAGRPRAEDCLDHIAPRLAQRADAPASQLSGGERQLLALAMTFQSKSAFYLLDEPFAGLSGETAARVRVAVSRWIEEDRASAIIAEHEREALAALCSEVIELADLRLCD